MRLGMNLRETGKMMVESQKRELVIDGDEFAGMVYFQMQRDLK